MEIRETLRISQSALTCVVSFEGTISFRETAHDVNRERKVIKENVFVSAALWEDHSEQREYTGVHR